MSEVADNLEVTRVAIVVETSDGVCRVAMITHANHNKKVLGLVRHLQGGKLILSKEPVLLLEASAASQAAPDAAAVETATV